jgi:hypothetical protein
MPLLNTSIPNLAQGVSQQPDNLRYPGQCDEQVNAWSTVVEGLVKRPNSRFLYDTDLGANVSSNLFSHYVDRDEQNKYVITYDSVNGLKAFDLTANVKTSIHINVPSIAASNYLSTSNPLQDLRALTIADSTFLVNTQKTIQRNTDEEFRTADLETDALVFVKLGDYDKAYSIFLSGQLVPVSSSLASEHDYTSHGDAPATYISGRAGHSDGKYADTEYIAKDLTTCLTDYVSSAKAVKSVNIAYGSGWTPTGGSSWRGTAYTYEFFIDQYDSGTGLLTASGAKGWVVFGGNGSVSSFQLTHEGADYQPSNTAGVNTKYTIRQVREWTKRYFGNFKKQQHRSAFTDSSVTLDSTGAVIATVNPLSITFPTTLSINVPGDFVGVTVTQQGSVIKISNTIDFQIRVSDGLANQGLGVIYKEVDSITDLPKSCFNRFRVKVIGEAELEQDDYYVQFKTKDNEDYGEGSWIETSGWNSDLTSADKLSGIDSAIDIETMPVRLIPSPATGKITSFDLQLINWTQRESGDDYTNPYPSFVSESGQFVTYSGSNYSCIKSHTSSGSILPTNTTYWKAQTTVPSNTKEWASGIEYLKGAEKRINDIFFFKNRLGLLTNDSIVFSEADEYFNFFRTTTQTLLDSAPIDVGISHTKISILKYAQAFQEKLMLFSAKTQFVLRGGDLLTPKTVTISPVTEYDVSESIRPLALSSHIYFNFKRNSFEGLLEYTVDNNTETYGAAEITEQVNKYIPSNIVRMEGSASENMIIVQSDSDYKKLFVYKYFWQGREKIQSSWMTFTFNKDVRSFYFIESTLHIITTDSDGTYLEKIPMENGLVDTGKNYALLLDHRVDGNSSYVGLGGWYPTGTPTPLSINGTNLTNVSLIVGSNGFEFKSGMSFYTKNGNKRTLTIDNADPTRAAVSGLIASFVSYSSHVTHNNKTYKCTQNHTADAVKEPGVGANWEDYWSEITTTIQALAWSLSTSYITGGLYLCTTGHTSSPTILPDAAGSLYWNNATGLIDSAPEWSPNGYEYISQYDFFVGFEYDMLYRFSKQNLKQPTERGGRSASDYTYQTIRNGSIEYSETGHFNVEVTPKFRDTYTYTYNPSLLASVSTLNKFTPETGFFKFAVQAQPNDATIEIKSSSALPVKLLSAEFESTIISRSRRYGG